MDPRVTLRYAKVAAGVTACARGHLAIFALRERTVEKSIFLCGDLGFLDCTFSHIDP